MESVIFIIIVIIVLNNVIKAVPPNTLIIVDRNTHYLKTKRSGFYFFNPSTDKVTTSISTYRTTKTYLESFETHDGEIVRVSFTASYHAENLDDVAYALASARRSIDDIMNGSIYWGVRNLLASDFKNTPIVLLNESKPKLLSEATELRIIVDDFIINGITILPHGVDVTPFKPHLSSSQSNGPIRFN